MGLYFTNETIESDSGDNNYVRNQMIEFNLKHFPDDLKGRYQEINLLLRNADGEILGGIVGEICWNWLEIHYLFVDERFRKSGYGAKLLSEVENMAREKQCEFVKLDTLSFQALDFYIKQGYEIYGKIENAGRHTHYYMKRIFKNKRRRQLSAAFPLSSQPISSFFRFACCLLQVLLNPVLDDSTYQVIRQRLIDRKLQGPFGLVIFLNV